MSLLASIPSPPRSEISLGPFPVRAYALAIITGVFVAVFIAERRWVARGGSKGLIADVAVVGVPAGIVGGRIYHVLTSWSQYADRPVDALKVWEGGLGIPGGLVGGVIGGLLVARSRGMRASALLDCAAPGIAVAQAIGRIGNWFNQELFGRPTDLPWALEIDIAHRPARFLTEPTFHPTFLYELLWNLVVAATVVIAERRFALRRGRAFALYVALYSAGRFVIEGIRIDPAGSVGGLRTNEVVSIVTFVLATAYLVATLRNGTDDRPVETSTDPVDADRDDLRDDETISLDDGPDAPRP